MKKSTAKLKQVNIKKILVPVNFSASSSNALKQAVPIAQDFLAKLLHQKPLPLRKLLFIKT